MTSLVWTPSSIRSADMIIVNITTYYYINTISIKLSFCGQLVAWLKDCLPSRASEALEPISAIRAFQSQLGCPTIVASSRRQTISLKPLPLSSPISSTLLSVEGQVRHHLRSW